MAEKNFTISWMKGIRLGALTLVRTVFTWRIPFKLFFLSYLYLITMHVPMQISVVFFISLYKKQSRLGNFFFLYFVLQFLFLFFNHFYFRLCSKFMNFLVLF